jgi:hypothetical protein
VNDGDWEILAAFLQPTSFVDPCVLPFTDYSYMVKAIRLENTGSGSYYNTSLGIAADQSVLENPALVPFFADVDMDGFGDPNTEMIACDPPPGFVDNNLDCDDENENIYPEAVEIPDNGIDEDCEDGDLITTHLTENSQIDISLYPNPTSNLLNVEIESLERVTYEIFDAYGKLVRFGSLQPKLDFSDFTSGIYWLKITDEQSLKSTRRKIIVME